MDIAKEAAGIIVDKYKEKAYEASCSDDILADVIQEARQNEVIFSTAMITNASSRFVKKPSFQEVQNLSKKIQQYTVRAMYNKKIISEEKYKSLCKTLN